MEKNQVKLSLNKPSMKINKDTISSPCIRSCCLNNDDICLGCFRSLNEITRWSQADEKTRRHFLNNAQSRQKALGNKVLFKSVLVKKA